MSESDGKGIRAPNGAAPRPTIIDVARAAGVSPATVSNTLNQRVPVDKATRAKVEGAVRKLGYTPNLRARRLRTGRADTIAILSSMSFAVAGGRARLGFAMEIAATAAVRALEEGVALVLAPPLTNGHSPVQDLHIDGALVVEPLETDAEIALLQSRGVPVVAIGRQLGNSKVPYIDLRPYDSACKVIAHLHERSSLRIGLIVGAQPRFTHRQTELAYRDYMRAQGGKAVVLRADENQGSEAGYAAAQTMLAQHRDLDALFVSVDAFAVGARRAAADLGIDVPERLKLATRYDGNLARECDPPITALDLHLDQVASLAVDLLFERISGQVRPRQSVDGPPATLVPRQSSATSDLGNSRS